MAVETKVILSLLLDGVAKSRTLEEAYNVIAKAASVEGMNALPYDEAVKEIEQVRQKDESK